MIDTQEIIQQYKNEFGHKPVWLSRAPGRVNLIGEHTDYNGGLVFPAAINREMKMAAGPRSDRKFCIYSTNFKQRVEFQPTDFQNVQPNHPWVNYFFGVIDGFRQRGFVMPGLNVVVSGDVPLGAGLSSSAAYEVCAATLLNHIFRAGLAAKDIALLAQEAEHSRFVGVRCGIMDQFISALGQANKALKLDCFSLSYELIPFNSNKASIVIINSMKKRGLVDSEYNRRRQECEEGLETLKKLDSAPFKTLRHVPMSVFEKYEDRLGVNVAKRVRHNLTENQRVKDFGIALKTDNFDMAGQLLYDSHVSLRDDFQVSCKELDAIADLSSAIGGCFGCRMTGAGFGGCAVALVKPDAVDHFRERLTQGYREAFNVTPDIYISKAESGAMIAIL